MKYIASIIDRITYLVFFILIFISWIFALQSSNLNLENVSNKLFLGIIILGIICLFLSRYISKLKCFFTNRLIISCCCLLVLVFQIIIVIKTSTLIGYDVTNVYNAQAHPNNDFIKFYFSLNTNNLNILFMQIGFRKLLGLGLSWLNLSYLTLFLVDLSAILNVLIIYLINKKLLIRAIYFQLLGLLVFPYIIVPYTDTWVMPFVSLYLLFFILEDKVTKLRLKFLMYVLTGGIAAVAYYVKPSAVIPFIAILIWMLLHKKASTLIHMTLFVTLLISFLGIATVETYAVRHQNYITITPDKNKPMVHFIAIGLEGAGGYSLEQDQAMMNAKNVQERKEYSIRRIKNRLKELGIAGYVKWLFIKQRNNTADGSLGWLADGNLNMAVPKDTLQNFYYTKGKYIGNFLFIAQLYWIFGLSLLLFGFKNRSDKIQFFRLAIIGGFIFLLIFEGGRSRYLIQFMPCLVVAMVLCSTSTGIVLKTVYSSVKKIKE